MSFRPLGYSESICAELYDRGGAGAIRSMTLVAGALAEDQARAAIRAIRRRHPVLDMRIGFAGQRFHFVHDKLETPDPVEIRDWGPDADPDAVLAESDQLHFGASDLPYRFVFLLDPAGVLNAIIGCLHHAICDGSSVDALLEEIVDLIAGTPSAAPAPDPYPAPPALEDQLVQGPGIMRFLAYAAKALGDERHRAPRHEVEVGEGAPGTRMIVVALSVAQSQALADRARRAKVSVSNLLGAAQLLAEDRMAEDKRLKRPGGPLIMLTPLDYRHLLPPPFRGRRDVVSLSVFLRVGYHRLPRAGGLVAAAQALRAQIHDPRFLDPQRYMFSWFHAGLMRRVLSTRSPKGHRFFHGLGATHLGRRRSAEGAQLRTIGTFLNVCVRDGNFLMHMISSFLNDRLWISFTYAPAFLSTATAGGLVDRLLDDLEIEGAVDRADGYHALARQIGLLEEAAAPTPPPGA